MSDMLIISSAILMVIGCISQSEMNSLPQLFPAFTLVFRLDLLFRSESSSHPALLVMLFHIPTFHSSLTLFFFCLLGLSVTAGFTQHFFLLVKVVFTEDCLGRRFINEPGFKKENTGMSKRKLP